MNRTPLNKVTPDDVATYKDQGVVCLRQMFDQNWVKRMHEASLDYIEQGTGQHRMREAKAPGENARFYINTFMSEYNSEFLNFRNSSPAAEIAANLMEVDQVRFWYDQMFVKEAGSSAPTQWYQDLPFWPFLGDHLVSIWLALTPVSDETSGVQYIAGSHKWDKFYCPVTPDEDPSYNDPDLETCPDFSERKGDKNLDFRSWDLEPGDCICHHPLTVHGAGGNSSTAQTRAAISIRYLGKDVRWDPRSNVLKLPRAPDLEPGAYPSDDNVFPVIWTKTEGVLENGHS